MIIRIKTGTSFKGAGLYYLHDKRQAGEAERLTTGRMAWTYAINTVEEEPEAILAEMRQTAFDQAMLRRESGHRSDGRPTENAVMTVALAWAPDEDPSREQMIEAGKSFLTHMGWDEHQVLFISHNDTKHPHVHLIVNRIHPETGMTLDDNWSKRRAQAWALEYEREHGRVLCPGRESKHEQDRPQANMNYRDWKAWQELSKNHAIDPEYQQSNEAGEWQVLKQVQKQERVGFWKETSRIRKEIRQDLREQVRQEFKEEWQAYAKERDLRLEQERAAERSARRAIRGCFRAGDYRAADGIRDQRKADHDQVREDLAELRKDIASRQRDRLEELTNPTLEDLKQERLDLYQALLARHRAERSELKDDQAEGHRRLDLLTRAHLANVGEQQFSGAEAVPGGSADAGQQARAADYAFYAGRREQDRDREREGDAWLSHEPYLRGPSRDLAGGLGGGGLSLVGRIAESIETLFDTSPVPGDQREKRAVDSERDLEKHIVANREDQRKQQDAEVEAKKVADMDFYINQRRR